MQRLVQKPEPPYVFVPLPEAKDKFPYPEILPHSAWQTPGRELHTGRLILKATVKSPVHIGSGLYELSEDVGFAKGFVVRGIVRTAGAPVIPGSSLKGAIRATYEACTRSCVRLFTSSMSEQYSTDWKRSKLPTPIVAELVETHSRPEHERVLVRLASDALREQSPCGEVKKPDDLKNLCPACALFGGLGYRGRLRFLDSHVVESTKGEVKAKQQVESANSPHLHRAGLQTVVKQERQRPVVEVADLQGRKFYRYGSKSQRRREPIDYLPIGAVLSFNMEYESLLPAEIGGILVCMGIADGPRLRVGGGKPLGLGELEVELTGAELRPADAILQYDLHWTLVPNLDSWVKSAINAFKNMSFFHLQGFDALHMLWQEGQGTQG